MNQIYQPTVIRSEEFKDSIAILGPLTIEISDSTLANWADSGAVDNNYNPF